MILALEARIISSDQNGTNAADKAEIYIDDDRGLGQITWRCIAQDFHNRSERRCEEKEIMKYPHFVPCTGNATQQKRWHTIEELTMSPHTGFAKKVKPHIEPVSL